jgi:hypothetical protein
MNLQVAFDESKVYPVSFAPDCGCNTTDEVLLDQIATNIRRGLPQVQKHEPNSEVLLIVCGGPSLDMTEQELVAEYWAGGKIVAVNGGYEWCLSRNLKPSAFVMIDAREFMADMVKRPIEGCRYLLASQCHPKTFETCRGRDILIWHALGTGSEAELELLKEYYFGRLNPVTIGTTIGVRVISVMRMLGFVSYHVFGLDSCWLDGKHHAYAQGANDKDGRVRTWLRSNDGSGFAQMFECAPWHMKQFEDFQSLIKERGNLFRLNVHGPGLIATAMRTGASLETGG